MPSGYFLEYILHLTMASQWLHDIVKASHQHHMQNYHFVRDCIGYHRVSIVCPLVGFVHASAQHWLFTKFVSDENRAKLKISYSCCPRVTKSARYDATLNELMLYLMDQD